MLIVVEDRDVHEFFEFLLNIEAVGPFDVLKVDTSERRR
jgi:hypothetical protein